MSVLWAQMAAIREGAKAIVAQADAVLAALVPAPIAEPVVRAVGEPCSHPAAGRLAAHRMGAPTAWVCGACGTEGDDALIIGEA